jgi:AcrR family transcriptional regulator
MAPAHHDGVDTVYSAYSEPRDRRPRPGRGDGPLRERLVDTGVALLEADGLADLTLRSIARAAGSRTARPAGTSRPSPICSRRSPNAVWRTSPAICGRHSRGRAGGRPRRGRRRGLPGLRPAAAEHVHARLPARPARGQRPEARERSLPILDALAAVLREETADDAAARAAALAVWTHVHGVATLTLTRALDLAATPEQRRDLLRTAVRAHVPAKP